MPPYKNVVQYQNVMVGKYEVRQNRSTGALACNCMEFDRYRMCGHVFMVESKLAERKAAMAGMDDKIRQWYWDPWDPMDPLLPLAQSLQPPPPPAPEPTQEPKPRRKFNFDND